MLDRYNIVNEKDLREALQKAQSQLTTARGRSKAAAGRDSEVQ